MKATRSTQFYSRSKDRGDIPLYIVIVMAMIMISTTSVLAILLTRQIPLTREMLGTERALQAATTGAEQMLWVLAKGDLSREGTIIRLQGFIEYSRGEEDVEYRVCGRRDDSFRSASIYKEQVRRLTIKAPQCEEWLLE